MDTGKLATEPAASDAALDALIAVQQEVSERANSRRQHADITGATLMTTAIALGAALVAAADGISDPDRIPQWAAYVALVSLMVTLALGVLARASVLQKVTSTTRDLSRQEHASTDALRDMAARAAPNPGEPAQPVDEATQPVDVRSIKEETLLLWRTTSQIRLRLVAFRNGFLLAAGVSLIVALTALGVIALEILRDAYR